MQLSGNTSIHKVRGWILEKAERQRHRNADTLAKIQATCPSLNVCSMSSMCDTRTSHTRKGGRNKSRIKTNNKIFLAY